MPVQIEVHKLGGTTVGSADRIRQAARLVTRPGAERRVVVSSAMATVTNALLEAAAHARAGDLGEARPVLDRVRQLHVDTIGALGLQARSDLVETCQDLLDEIEALLRAVVAVGELSARVRDRIQSTGEKLAVRILAATLEADGHPATALDADTFLETDDRFGEASPLEGVAERTTRAAILPVLESGRIAVVTGFCGQAPDGATTTLGRGGSDFSATLLAAALGAERAIIWTDVPGVYTTDPRVVPDARLVAHLNYREAGELAFYGAKVLHPRTLKPVASLGIPVDILSSFDPDEPGTRIDGCFTPGSHPIKAISAIRGHVLLSIVGKGMAGVPGVSARLFAALAESGISVTVISQSSAESSICVAIPVAHAVRAEIAVRREFRLDLAHGDVEDVKVQPDVGLLAAVGLGMAHTTGVAARVTGALGKAGVNILAIAQGSSELNITIAVDGRDVDAAIRALHRALGLHRIDTGETGDDAFDLLLIGWGNIGRAVAAQLRDHQARIADRFGLRGRIVGISDRSGYLLRPTGIDAEMLGVADARKVGGEGVAALEGAVATAGGQNFLEDALRYRLARPVVVDVSASDTTGEALGLALDAGCDVVTANKKPLAGDIGTYRDLMQRARDGGRVLRAEATVGAGLPVVDTLDMLLVTGDRLTRAEGCLSGTLGYVLSRLQDGAPLSRAVREAADQGYTEPDPYEDLCGADVGRKAIILGRIAGFDIPADAVEVVGLVGPEIAGMSRDDFFRAIEASDDAWAQRVEAARESGQVIRYVASVRSDGIRVAPTPVPIDSPLGGLRGTDNMIVFHSERYDERPLVIQGPGAGIDVTAMGVLGDVVRIVAERR